MGIRQMLNHTLKSHTLLVVVIHPNYSKSKCWSLHFMLLFCKIYTLHNNVIIEFYDSNVPQSRLNTYASRTNCKFQIS